MPKVSIIIPIYGVEKYIHKALNSVLNQTLHDIEIILIDDGGKDKCPQIIDEYAQKDKRVKAFHKENGGYGAACNFGLNVATGEYVAIFEPDDYIAPKMYEDLYNIGKNFNSDIVKSCFYHNIQENAKIEKADWDNELIPKDKSFTLEECSLFLYYHPSIWTCIYRREFLKEHNIQFIEAPGAGWTDNPFQVQTLCLAKKINYTPEAYYYWRRLYRNHSFELKDYTLPFIRSNEIHNWLSENLINNVDIMTNLAKRELNYINIVLGMTNISDKKDCFQRIKNLCTTIYKNNNNISKNLTNKEKFQLWFYSNLPYLAYLNKQFIYLRKKIVTIRWNKDARLIKIAGKVLYKK